MADKPDPTDDPADGNPNPTPADGGDTAPQWAQELSRAITDLPSKLRATLTDEDRDSIAERVHGLFEGSGAFRSDEPKDDDGDEGNDADEPPAKETGLKTFAKRFQGGK